MGLLAIPKEVLKLLKERKKFLILGHEKPDADCLSSQLALQSVLTRCAKESYTLSKGPFERTEIMAFEPLFASELNEKMLSDQPAVVVLDCGGLERTGFAHQLPEELDVLVIDHHPTGVHKADLLYLDPLSPSTSLLIQQIIEALNPPLTYEEAEQVFLGFATDTGYFRFLDEHQGSVFPLLGRLLDAGVSPRSIQQRITSCQPFSTVTLIGKLLLRVRSFYEGRLRITYEMSDDLQSNQIERDSPQLYNLLLNTTDTEIVIFLREQCKNWTVSFRSHHCDVGKMANQFGGGGHKHAAGCLLQIANIEEAIKALVSGAAPLLES